MDSCPLRRLLLRQSHFPPPFPNRKAERNENLVALYLAQMGLIDLREAKKKVPARVSYDTILLEIAV